MNERIKLLAKDAGINLTPAQFSGVLEDEVDEFTLEKFAELIVKECCDMVNKQHQYNNPNDCLLVLDIKEHFGVEE
jgi:hypothetical protein